MHHALLYKEYIKTRLILVMCLAVVLVAVGYTWICFSSDVRIGGAVGVWAMIVQNGYALPAIDRYALLLCGIAMGAAQYVPEMEDRRLRLTLHLPLAEKTIVGSMLHYGFMTTCGLSLLMILGVALSAAVYFPNEVVVAFVVDMIPWALGGMTAYYLVGWICVEPKWGWRVKNIVGAVVVEMGFLLGATNGDYFYMIPWLVLALIVSQSLPLRSVVRFKEGNLK